MIDLGERRDDGFTMLEMIITLSIIAMVSTLAIIGVEQTTKPPSLDLLIKSTQSVMLQARQRAILAGTVQRVKIDAKEKRLSLDENTSIDFPSSSQLKVITAQPLAFDQTAEIQFNPNGGASGGTLEVTDQSGRTKSIRVSWITGLPSVLEDQER